MIQEGSENNIPADPRKLRRVLVVDGPRMECERLVEQLAHECSSGVDSVRSGTDALMLAKRHPYDAALLAIELSDMEGWKLVQILRRSKFRAPIILLSAAYAEAEVVQGLDAGANDYVAMPYPTGVLLARLRAHLRQFERTGDATFALGPYLFDPARKRLIPSGQRRSRTVTEHSLTEKECRILRFLYQRRGQVVDRADLMRGVWDYRSDIESHTVETHIYRLRQKVEPDPAHPRIILSVPGGYLLRIDWSSELADCEAAEPVISPAIRPVGARDAQLCETV